MKSIHTLTKWCRAIGLFIVLAAVIWIVPAQTAATETKCCSSNAQCGTGEYCQKNESECNGPGWCQPLPDPGISCTQPDAPVCGCDGKSYNNSCEANRQGVNIAAIGQCGLSGPSWKYYFPAIKDNDSLRWENSLSIQAKDPVPMDVTIRVHDMLGYLKGTYIYSNTDPAANRPALTPNARVALRPSWIAGTTTDPLPIEGSIIVETSAPAIASTNCAANFFKGFSIYESAKARSVHYFPKAYDGPDNFEVSILVQNIYEQSQSISIKLLGKYGNEPYHGFTTSRSILPKGTVKFRPSELIGNSNFDGSVVVSSDLCYPEDGSGPPLPAMCRYEAGENALPLYESTVVQSDLSFPIIRDGKFAGTIDYQNFVSLVNPSPTATATFTMILYNKAGSEEGRITNYKLLPGGKVTWRPSWIKGSLSFPKDFEGSIVVTSDIPIVGQTNTIYPGINRYDADAFDLVESAIPASSLFFPKAYDNLPGSGTGATPLIDHFVYIQNPAAVARNISIDLCNSNGTLNRTTQAAITPHAVHVFRPKDLVTDGTGAFRGSVRITETVGLPVAGAIKYEMHKTTLPKSEIESITIYRSMGQ